MRGLPSTTEVSLRLPKEAFYRNLKVDAKTRDKFVSGVESIVVTNSIKPATCNLADGRRVHEILVVEATPKGDEVPEVVVRTISAANPNRVLVVDAGTGRAHALEAGRLVSSGGPVERLSLVGRDLDGAWDSILAQVALGDEDGTDVMGRIERAERVEALRREADRLEQRARKERQVARKNALFDQAREKRAELRALEEKVR